MTTVIDLPLPPSVNGIWRSRRGHGGKPVFFLAPRYQTWKRAADNFFMAQKRIAKPVAGEFIATITLNEKKLRKGSDIDNRVKAAMDWLQRSGLIENDKLARKLTVGFGVAPEGCRITLKAASVKEAA